MLIPPPAACSKKGRMGRVKRNPSPSSGVFRRGAIFANAKNRELKAILSSAGGAGILEKTVF